MEGQIALYFELGLGYPEILRCLAHIDHLVISMSTLKRSLKRQKLSRRGSNSDIVDVCMFILHQQENSGRDLGYRMMYLKCIQNGLRVTQDTVRALMHITDPTGMANRRRRRLSRREYLSCGPNYIWHMDSYDKLKPYGICINGAIDGFSRYIIWLEAYTTNSDPRIVAGYFMKEVKRRSGCPARMRVDRGTENCVVRDMLLFMRRNDQDEHRNNCFLVGSSNHNQRIEQWWGSLRRMNIQRWMDTFGNMKEMGYFVGGFLDKSLIQFCFMDLIQSELDQVVNLWNTHRIRNTRNIRSPAGRPVMLYSCSALYNTHDYLCPVPDNEVAACVDECSQKGQYCCDETVHQLCTLLMEEQGLNVPSSADEAVVLYQTLRRQILDEM